MTGFSAAVCAVIDERSGRICEVCDVGKATQRHHRRPRQAGGSKRDDTNTPQNCLHLCHHCHSLIEHNRSLGYLMGWLLSQNVIPDMERVMYRGEWKLLGPDGGVEQWEMAA